MPPSALSSVAPVAWTPPTPPTDVAPFGGWQQAGGSRGREPTLRQTLVAALAGPLLVAIAAGAMAVTLAMGPALRAAGRAPAMQAAESSHITAKSATSAPRTKAVSPQVQVVSARCARNPRGAMCGARN